MKQLLLNVYDDGSLSLLEINATVPSGMAVQLGDMRTDQLLCPVKIELKPIAKGTEVFDISNDIREMQKRASEYTPRVPWR